MIQAAVVLLLAGFVVTILGGIKASSRKSPNRPLGRRLVVVGTGLVVVAVVVFLFWSA